MTNKEDHSELFKDVVVTAEMYTHNPYEHDEPEPPQVDTYNEEMRELIAQGQVSDGKPVP